MEPPDTPNVPEPNADIDCFCRQIEGPHSEADHRRQDAERAAEIAKQGGTAHDVALAGLGIDPSELMGRALELLEKNKKLIPWYHPTRWYMWFVRRKIRKQLRASKPYKRFW